jgi:hypothetical protein
MPPARRKVLDMRARFVEEGLAALATRQHGVVARRQLLALGLVAAAIGRRLDAGRLHVSTRACTRSVTRFSPITRGGWPRCSRVDRRRRWLVTTPARTILDYAAIATDRELRYTLDQARSRS